MQLQDYDITTTYQATVVRSDRITPPSSTEVRELVLDIDRPDFDAQPGQSIGVLAPGQAEFGQEHHFRLYSIADIPEHTADAKTRIQICVRRCSYIDKFSGERYSGVASKYLCKLAPGATLTVSGPYEVPFPIPDEPDAALILIGTGTGIAPFRAFLKQLFREQSSFRGRVILFHGGRTGLDLWYHNNERDDFARYYDDDTFEAIKVLSERPHWSESIDWHSALEPRAAELWRLLSDARTYVYLAGLHQIADELDTAFNSIAGSADRWQRRKAELAAGGRWVELLY